MKNYNLYKLTSLVLISLATLSFFLGFYFDENSTGAAGYNGDFEHIYTNLKFFLNHDLITSIKNPEYHDSRPPTSYILQEILNPFAKSEIGYRRSVFFISFLVPILFYFCLKQKFKKEESLILLLISSTIFLSPYFRASAYWGLQENYGYIFLLLTFLSMSLYEKYNQLNFIGYFKLFLIAILSSLCVYFDQKLIIIPAICFLQIIFSDKLLKAKIFVTLCYFVFSLPYIYLISIWESIIPSQATTGRQLGETLYLDHIGYSLTMIAFYLLPLLFFKTEKIVLLFKNFFSNNKNYFLISLCLLYLFYLIFFFDVNNEVILGNGFIHKVSIIIFKGSYYGTLFTYFSFFISWIIILVYLQKNFKDYLILGYFLLLAIIIWPIFQEYFDPLIIIIAFTFFNTKIYLNYKNSLILFIYLSLFLITTNVYYLGLLN